MMFDKLFNMDAPSAKNVKFAKTAQHFALATRITVICLQIVSNSLIPDHDAGVFNPPVTESAMFNVVDRAVVSALGGLRRWDAIYFIHIAQHGYTYENCLAFFPLYPLTVTAVANSILYPLQYAMSYFTVLLISSVVINLFLFVKTAVTLYKLGLQVTDGNECIAYTGALLFCINPASIFMAAPYSETLYMYLTLQGMLALELNNKLSASVLFGLSCSCRSNGLLNIGYLAYKFLKNSVPYTTKLRTSGFFLSVLNTLWTILYTLLVPYTFLLLISVTPFLVYQCYCYCLYCVKTIPLVLNESILQYGVSENLQLYGGEPSPWCDEQTPLAYSYIQSHYWDQGLFHYWRLKQIPNFLLALPVTILAMATISSYYKHNRHVCWTLGLDDMGTWKRVENDRAGNRMENDRTGYRMESPSAGNRMGGCRLLPYIVHLLLLSAFGWMFIHIQVLTRLLFSSCPVLYWFSAQVISMAKPQQQPITMQDTGNQPTTKCAGRTLSFLNRKCKNILTEKISKFGQQDFPSKLLLFYFLSYFIIGTVLFSNFLPWT